MPIASEQIVIGTLSAQKINKAINILLVKRTQDWKTRQKIAYEAMKGYILTDFHSLKDFQEQMQILMKGAPPTMKITWAIASRLIPLQRRLRITTVMSPTLGRVGRFLLSLAGFQSVFRVPTEILSKKSKIGGFF
jgi:hypothetical protein